MWSESLYRWLTDSDSEQRTCSAIPDDACSEVPRSFVLNTANGAATELAEDRLLLPTTMRAQLVLTK